MVKNLKDFDKSQNQSNSGHSGLVFERLLEHWTENALTIINWTTVYKIPMVDHPKSKIQASKSSDFESGFPF